MRLFGGSYWLCEQAREASCAPAADLFVQHREPRGGVNFDQLGLSSSINGLFMRLWGLEKPLSTRVGRLWLKEAEARPKFWGSLEIGKTKKE